VAPAKKALPSQRFAAVGGVVLALVLAAAGFLWLRWDAIFPNSKPEAGESAPGPDPIARATALHEKGKTASAVRQLRLLPPDHPRYAEAQQLIAQWEATPAEPETPTEPAGPTPDSLARRDRELELARQAYAQGEYLLADSRFRRAAQVAPLTGTAAELAADAQAQLEPLKLQLELFQQGDWALALRDLWRLHQAQPGNRDIVRLMVDSYYNLAVRELQRGNPEEAVKQFDEALALRPDSEVLQRHRRFAQTYVARPQDLLYRIYVRYLPLL
jgi:tetratricopeptide (TPR) repeat protein